MVIICLNLNPLHPRMFRPKFGWYWPSCSGKEDFKISFMKFHNVVIISPRKRVLTFLKLSSLSSKNTLCQVWLQLIHWFCKRIFENFVNVFSLFIHYFIVISLIKRMCPLIWRNYIVFLPKNDLSQILLKLAHSICYYHL